MEDIVGQVVQANGSPPPRLATNPLVASLRLTVEWIDNLERAFGKDAVLGQMPNNFGGRAELEGLIQEWEKEF